MEYRRFGDRIVVRLDKGDEILDSIRTVALSENIKLASITGIGGSDDITVGVWGGQDYVRQHFDTTHEITSLVGNINTMKGDFYEHLHITCAGNGGKVVGGHLLRCVISLTAEIFIQVLEGTVDRERDPELGINKFCFS